MSDRGQKKKGVSLAKGPVALIGLALLAYGVTGFVFGGNGFTNSVPDGTVNGETWLGVEVNGWSNLLFIAAGALLLLGAPLHWGAKTLGLVVGLALGAASVIAIVDGDDVFGIFAANGLTKLVWGVASAALLLFSMLPRVGGKKPADDDRDRRPAAPQRVERERVVEREPVAERRPVPRGNRAADSDRDASAERDDTGSRRLGGSESDAGSYRGGVRSDRLDPSDPDRPR